MRTPEQIAADTIREAYAHGDNVTPEEMLETVLDVRDERTPHDLFDLIECAAREAQRETSGYASYQLGYNRGYREAREVEPQFAPEGEPDEYRDLWDANMPRASGCMYFAIPGEQPIHVDDEQAHHILAYLSEQEGGVR